MNKDLFDMLASTILGNFASGVVWPLIHIYIVCNL